MDLQLLKDSKDGRACRPPLIKKTDKGTSCKAPLSAQYNQLIHLYFLNTRQAL